MANECITKDGYRYAKKIPMRAARLMPHPLELRIPIIASQTSGTLLPITKGSLKKQVILGNPVSHVPFRDTLKWPHVV